MNRGIRMQHETPVVTVNDRMPTLPRISRQEPLQMMGAIAVTGYRVCTGLSVDLLLGRTFPTNGGLKLVLADQCASTIFEHLTTRCHVNEIYMRALGEAALCQWLPEESCEALQGK
jgi:hypothetical protein